MGFYRTKVINYGLKEKVLLFDNPVAYGNSCKTTITREKYKDMSALKQKEADNRRICYYKKKVIDFIDIALMNTDLNMAFTLTFKHSITSYDCAVARWQLFLKRLRHQYPDLKYICVWEYQKQRSQTECIENGGIFHFHCLMNIGYIKHNTLEKIWKYGYVWIDYLGNENQRMQGVKYMMKYITKEVIENTSDKGKRYIFTSNNLLKPQVTLLSDSYQKEDIIFKHMENVIKDGEYNLHNSIGKIINHVDYIEFKKLNGE